MCEVNDGGPAFPMPGPREGEYTLDRQNGMSLRDWFAGMALPALLKHALVEPDNNLENGSYFDDLCDGEADGTCLVEAAFRIADTMIDFRLPDAKRRA